MNEQTKFSFQQQFSNEDLYEIKTAIKGKQKNNQNRKQIPSAFFALSAMMSFLSFLQDDRVMSVVYLIAAIFCAIVLYYVVYVDSNGVFLYRIMLAKTLPYQVVFYEGFIQCQITKQEMSILLYEEILHIYELENIVVVKTKLSTMPYCFLIKRNMSDGAFTFLKQRKEDCYQDVRNQEDFLLR